MVGTCNVRLKNIKNFNPSEEGFYVKLENGAECNFNKNNLKCSYNTDRFNERIEIENIELKLSESEANNKINKTFYSRVTDDMKVTYDVKYPDTGGSISVISEFKALGMPTFDGYVEDDKYKIFNGLSNMKIERFSKGDKADFEFGENAEYAIINCAKRSFEIDNKKLEGKIMYGTDSKFEIESFGQKLED